MLLSKNIDINIVNKNIKKMKLISPNIKLGDILNIKIDYLPKGSSILVECQCDNCGLVKMIPYKDYNKTTICNSENYYCKKCSFIRRKQTNLEKYGVENPFQSEDFKNKIKQTNLEKYGVEYASQSNEIKTKTKQTNLEKYGVEWVTQSEDFKIKSELINLEKYGVEYASQSNEIKIKTKQTNLEKYGVENPFQSEDFKNKLKKINLEKYGVEYRLQTNEVKSKAKKTKNNKTYIKWYNIIKKSEYKLSDYNDNIFYLYHYKCGTNFEIHLNNLNDRYKENICLCTQCYPISEQKSIKEKEIVIWLKELNIDFIESDKNILNPRHLDIYIPSNKLAIEFNGLYWHSELYKDKNYHLEKSLKCLEKGIRLLHIWEDEWVYKQDIVKSIILNRLGLIKEKIYARQCEIRVVEDSKLVRQFLDENHIQGYSQSSIKLGLYYKNELVSLMTFGYRHTNAKKEFELIRFCNRINLNVIGAASKLFNYFKQNYEFTDLISYSDFRLFDGKMYETLGFEKKHLSKPDYFWCNNKLERNHRFNFNKQKLIKKGYDSSKTEVEIMHERGYFRIFGCGQYRWIYGNSLFGTD
jgi:hypothetical protein